METKENKSVFETLNVINCSAHTEKKQGLTYLSWAWAWAEVKKAYPNAFYTIYENANGLFYHTDGKTAWVKTGVTIEDIEHIEYLPVLNASSHASLKLEQITSWDVNKAIQRSLTKACARHGLGLYIYAGEDLPEDEKEQTKYTANQQPQANQPQEEHITPEVQTAVNCATNADTIEQLQKVWNDWPHLQKHTAFKSAVTLRKSQLQ